MKFISKNSRNIFIGLNPTNDAKSHKAVFCRDAAFWNLLKMANIKPFNNVLPQRIEKLKKSKGSYKNFASAYFNANSKYGFTDLLPNIYNTNSNKVKPKSVDVENLIKTLANTDVEKIGLMHSKVIKAFKNANVIQNYNGNNGYGNIGYVIINNKKVEVYTMPFPSAPISTKQKVPHYAAMR